MHQDDAKNQRVSFVYDALGNKVKQLDYANKNETVVSTTAVWKFNTATGKLDSVSQGAAYKDDYHYDSYGRLNQVTYTRDEQTFVAQTRYDKHSRVAQQFDPVPLVDKCFDDNGAVNGTCWGVEIGYQNGYIATQFEARNGADPNRDSHYKYRQIDGIDAFGNVTNYRLGGVAAVTKEYNRTTGYLSSVSAVANQLNVMNASYTFDSFGNLTNRTRHTLNTDAALTINGEEHNIQAQTYGYDNLGRVTTLNNETIVSYAMNGNISNKLDVQDNAEYQYGTSHNLCSNTAGPHAISQVGDLKYCYDSNGSQTHQYENDELTREITYSIFDKATHIDNHDGISTSFSYGPSRARYKRVDVKDSTTTTTYYIGNIEHVSYNEPSKSAEIRRNLPNLLHTVYQSTGGEQFRFLLTDHLGSVDSYLDHEGKIVAKMYFDAWGNKAVVASLSILNQDTLSSAYGGRLADVLSISPRGFTGHEPVDDLGIIHMNGRIYDPTLGRFLQADPFIQAPNNSQNYNRYSYVLNNPMSYTDPSGYFFKAIGKFVKKYWRTIVAVGLAAVGGYYALAALKAGAIGTAYGIAAASGFASGYVSTGSLRGALTGAFTSVAFLGVGQATMGAHNAIKVLAHGVTGGIISDLQGGKFGHGFISAGITKGAQVAGMISDKLIQGALQSAIVGGTVSKLTGGKFANGAITAAFQFAMNQYVSSKLEGSIGIKKLFGALEAEFSTDKGFDAKFKSALKDGGVNLELDSNGQIKVMGGDGKQIGYSIDGSQHGLEGQIDVKAASFALSLKPDQDGILAVEWKIGISAGIFSGAYSQVHHYDMTKIPLFNNFRRYYQPENLQRTGPKSICNHAPQLRACQG